MNIETKTDQVDPELSFSEQMRILVEQVQDGLKKVGMRHDAFYAPWMPLTIIDKDGKNKDLT